MGIPVRNLAAQNYLHSNKWTFFDNMAYYSVFGQLQFQDKLSQSIATLEKDLVMAKEQEAEFYEDFSFPNLPEITTPQEWSQRFLRASTDKNNKISVLTNIFHSIELYHILSNSSSDDKAIRKILRDIANNSTNLNNQQKDKILDIIRKEGTVAFGEVFNDLGILGKEHKLEQGLFLEDLYQAVTKTTRKKAIEATDKAIKQIKGALRAKDSPKFKELERALLKKDNDRTKKLNLSLDFIQRKMVEANIFNIKEIDAVLSMWRELYNNDIDKDDSRIIDNDITKVEGKVQELERRITLSEVFITFSVDYYENISPKDIEQHYTVAGYRTLVQSTGDKLVKRFRREDGSYNEAESKTDSIFRGKSGRIYRIQEKNSIGDMYKQFDTSGDPNTLPTQPSQIKLQSKVNFSTLEQYFIEGKIFTHEELQYLSYLLINFNALNTWSHENDGDARLWKAKGKNAVRATFTRDLIDKIMTQGIKAYISDLIIPDNIANPLDFQNWNFIIFRGQMLIPLSYLIEQLLNYLKDSNDNMMVMRTYSKVTGISAGYLKNVYSEKQEAMKDDPAPEDKNYHWDNLVQIGIDAGDVAYKGLTINSIYLKFGKEAVNNLINPKLL